MRLATEAGVAVRGWGKSARVLCVAFLLAVAVGAALAGRPDPRAAAYEVGHEAFDGLWLATFGEEFQLYPLSVDAAPAGGVWDITHVSPATGISVTAQMTELLHVVIEEQRYTFEDEDSAGTGWVEGVVSAVAGTLVDEHGLERHVVGAVTSAAYEFVDEEGDVWVVDGVPLVAESRYMAVLSVHDTPQQAIVIAESVPEVLEMMESGEVPADGLLSFPSHDCEPGSALCPECLKHCAATIFDDIKSDFLHSFIIGVIIEGCLNIEVHGDDWIGALKHYRVKFDLFEACIEGAKGELREWLVFRILDYVYCLYECNPASIVRQTATCVPFDPPLVDGGPTPVGSGDGGGADGQDGSAAGSMSSSWQSHQSIDLDNRWHNELLRSRIASDWGVSLPPGMVPLLLEPGAQVGVEDATLMARRPSIEDIDPNDSSAFVPGYDGLIPGGEYREFSQALLFDTASESGLLTADLEAPWAHELTGDGIDELQVRAVAGSLRSPGGIDLPVFGLRLMVESGGAVSTSLMLLSAEASLADAGDQVDQLMSLELCSGSSCDKECCAILIAAIVNCLFEGVDAIKNSFCKHLAPTGAPFIICYTTHLAYKLAQCALDIRDAVEAAESCQEALCPGLEGPRIIVLPNPLCPIPVVPLPSETPEPDPSETPDPVPPGTPEPDPTPDPDLGCPGLATRISDTAKRCEQLAECAPLGAAVPGCPGYVGEGGDCIEDCDLFLGLTTNRYCNSLGCLCEQDVTEACDVLRTACLEGSNQAACAELCEATGDPEACEACVNPLICP